jgi:hypothetical protein
MFYISSYVHACKLETSLQAPLEILYDGSQRVSKYSSLKQPDAAKDQQISWMHGSALIDRTCITSVHGRPHRSMLVLTITTKPPTCLSTHRYCCTRCVTTFIMRTTPPNDSLMRSRARSTHTASAQSHPHAALPSCRRQEEHEQHRHHRQRRRRRQLQLRLQLQERRRVQSTTTTWTCSSTPRSLSTRGPTLNRSGWRRKSLGRSTPITHPRVELAASRPHVSRIDEPPSRLPVSAVRSRSSSPPPRARPPSFLDISVHSLDSPWLRAIWLRARARTHTHTHTHTYIQFHPSANSLRCGYARTFPHFVRA